jgi:hypothetical protein
MDPSDLIPYAPTIAIVVGGAWAYWRFVRERDRYPRVTLEARIEQVAWFGDERIVRVSVAAKNDGTVRLVIPKMRYTLRTLREGDPLEDGGENLLGQPVFPHVDVRRRPFTHPRHEYAFVDAGTTTSFSSLARLPASARVVIAQVTLRYRDPRSDFHGAAAVLELPVRSQSPAASKGTRARRTTPDDSSGS